MLGRLFRRFKREPQRPSQILSMPLLTEDVALDPAKLARLATSLDPSRPVTIRTFLTRLTSC